MTHALQSPKDYADEQRKCMLRLARRTLTLAAELGEKQAMRRWPDLPIDDPALNEPRACFVSLHRRGDLRGCIGTLEPGLPLWRCVVRNAASAALHDNRFAPVETDEVPEITIEISVLTVPKPISPEEVVIGRDGLFLEKGGYRGVFLPQVPVEWNWKREEYLRQLSRKAGLPPDGWTTGQLSAFQAEVFGESDYPGLREEPIPTFGN